MTTETPEKQICQYCNNPIAASFMRRHVLKHHPEQVTLTPKLSYIKMAKSAYAAFNKGAIELLSLKDGDTFSVTFDENYLHFERDSDNFDVEVKENKTSTSTVLGAYIKRTQKDVFAPLTIGCKYLIEKVSEKMFKVDLKSCKNGG